MTINESNIDQIANMNFYLANRKYQKLLRRYLVAQLIKVFKIPQSSIDQAKDEASKDQISFTTGRRSTRTGFRFRLNLDLDNKEIKFDYSDFENDNDYNLKFDPTSITPKELIEKVQKAPEKDIQSAPIKYISYLKTALEKRNFKIEIRIDVLGDGNFFFINKKAIKYGMLLFNSMYVEENRIAVLESLNLILPILNKENMALYLQDMNTDRISNVFLNSSNFNSSKIYFGRNKGNKAAEHNNEEIKKFKEKFEQKAILTEELEQKVIISIFEGKNRVEF